MGSASPGEERGSGAELAPVCLAPGLLPESETPQGRQGWESAGPNNGYFSTNAPRHSVVLKAYQLGPRRPSKFQT